MGGPKAPLSPQESVTAMRGLIETLGPNQSGKFYNYDGREYPWELDRGAVSTTIQSRSAAKTSAGILLPCREHGWR
jgi:hypothetical protein